MYKQIDRSMGSILNQQKLVKTENIENDNDSSTTSMSHDIRRTYEILRWENPNYKHIDLLFRSIAYNGKILSARFTKADIAQQRKLSKSVKQARILGLLPFVHKDFDRSHL